MPKIVQVRLQEGGRILHFHTRELAPRIGEEVIVEGARGEEFGNIIGKQEMPPREDGEPFKKVKRLATAEDKKRLEENKKKEEEASRACLRRIEEREIPMKLVDAEYSFDRSRITFYFTAEERIDFRELVKDLAHLFKARIEMRQIGVRDEAKRLGGYGCCGRSLCCATFLKDFEPVTIRMAKDQRLSLDPSKVSGSCGRLLCCLMFEYQTYREMGRKMPKERTRVTTEQGDGEIVDIHILKQTVTVALEEGQKIEVPLDKLSRSQPPRTRTRKRKENSGNRRRSSK